LGQGTLLSDPASVAKHKTGPDWSHSRSPHPPATPVEFRGSETGEVVGEGTVVLSGANSYTGGTTLPGGTLRLGATGALPASRDIAFSGGKLDVNDLGQTVAGSHTLTLGSLSLSANSTLDLKMAAVASDDFEVTLKFAGLGTLAGGTTLTVQNWRGSAGQSGDDDRLVFTVDPESLLSHLRSADFGDVTGAKIDLGGGLREVVPAPEPATWLAGGFMLGILGWTERRRFLGWCGKRAKA
jgi:autotransporter-associated beta strand protein